MMMIVFNGNGNCLTWHPGQSKQKYTHTHSSKSHTCTKSTSYPLRWLIKCDQTIIYRREKFHLISICDLQQFKLVDVISFIGWFINLTRFLYIHWFGYNLRTKWRKGPQEKNENRQLHVNALIFIGFLTLTKYRIRRRKIRRPR